eukprot:TRINITY_DN61218_c0_g1_i1.p1 TRINITY_DN61218_c0_g1~~TRINITY_DN61218_c0_g1_i1.p1  ORF type:complete len:515 (+),score=86.85 TRINITY_DN61218_c0_g1_i1:142-1686(+)
MAMGTADGPIKSALQEAGQDERRGQHGHERDLTPRGSTRSGSKRSAVTPPRSGGTPRGSGNVVTSSTYSAPSSSRSFIRTPRSYGILQRQEETTPRGSVAETTASRGSVASTTSQGGSAASSTTPRASTTAAASSGGEQKGKAPPRTSRTPPPASSVSAELDFPKFLKRNELFLEERKQFLEAYREIREQQEMRECTFEPRRVKTTPRQRSGSMGSIYERGLEAEARKAERARQLRQDRFDEEMAACSFHPNVQGRRASTPQAFPQQRRVSFASVDSGSSQSSAQVGSSRRRGSGASSEVSSYAAAYASASATAAAQISSGACAFRGSVADPAAGVAGGPRRCSLEALFSAATELESLEPPSELENSEIAPQATPEGSFLFGQRTPPLEQDVPPAVALVRLQEYLRSYGADSAPADPYASGESPRATVFADVVQAAPVVHPVGESWLKKAARKQAGSATASATAATIADGFEAAVSKGDIEAAPSQASDRQSSRRGVSPKPLLSAAATRVRAWA